MIKADIVEGNEVVGYFISRAKSFLSNFSNTHNWQTLSDYLLSSCFEADLPVPTCQVNFVSFDRNSNL